jgi:tetratricopeptide (TPR) repeat protein
VGWFWYLGTLVPVIGLVQVGAQSMADRYTYIPIIGLLIIIVWGLHDLTQSWQCQGTASAIACGLVSLVCISLTHRQLGYWMDCERLFRHTLAVTENNTIAHNNLASALYDTGHPDEAIAELKEALSLSPQSPGIHYNLGLALAKSGQVDDAIKQFHIALKISPQSPFYHNDLANAFVIKGDLDDAIREYQEAIRLNPLQPDFHNNLGVTLLKKGRWDDAIHECQEALRLSPGFEKARIALANALNQKKASQPGGM